MAAAEPGNRFAHLLQPIKDLSKIWKIEIADELEKYLDEVDQLLLSDPESGISQLNFAEAALLIQGSTAIYSRKVELLYQLVYEALEQCVKKEGLAQPGRKKQTQPTGLWAPIPETEELLTIDHLIKEGRNIQLDPNAAATHRPTLQRRVPLFLMPREASDRRKKEFRISSCTVHHSGIFLLQESDASLLDEMNEEVLQPGGLSVPAPSREVHDLDMRLQALLQKNAEESEAAVAQSPAVCEALQADLGVFSGECDPPSYTRDFAADFADASVAADSLEAAISSCPRPLGRRSSAARAGPDPWALLDENEKVGKELPLVVGNTSKPMDRKHLLLCSADSLPYGSREAPSDTALWGDSTGAAACSASALPMLAAGHPVESLFLTIAGRLKPGTRCEAQRAGFSAAWLEFEDLLCAAASKHRGIKAQAKDAPAFHQAEGFIDALPSEDAPAPMTPLGREAADAGACSDAEAPDLPLVMDEHVGQSEEKRELGEDQRREVAALETQILEAQQKYEATIRQHLKLIQKDGTDTDAGKFPQLYANVRKWQDQLAPILKENEDRPAFDIEKQSSKLLGQLVEAKERCASVEAPETVPFSLLADGQPRWQVCRQFLTCLLLTNQGNIDIEFSTEEERLNGFKLRLVKAERKPKRLRASVSDAATTGSASDAAQEEDVDKEVRRRGDLQHTGAPAKKAAKLAGGRRRCR